MAGHSDWGGGTLFVLSAFSALWMDGWMIMDGWMCLVCFIFFKIPFFNVSFCRTWVKTVVLRHLFDTSSFDHFVSALILIDPQQTETLEELGHVEEKGHTVLSGRPFIIWPHSALVRVTGLQESDPAAFEGRNPPTHTPTPRTGHQTLTEPDPPPPLLLWGIATKNHQMFWFLVHQMNTKSGDASDCHKHFFDFGVYRNVFLVSQHHWDRKAPFCLLIIQK